MSQAILYDNSINNVDDKEKFGGMVPQQNIPFTSSVLGGTGGHYFSGSLRAVTFAYIAKDYICLQSSTAHTPNDGD